MHESLGEGAAGRGGDPGAGLEAVGAAHAPQGRAWQRRGAGSRLPVDSVPQCGRWGIAHGCTGLVSGRYCAVGLRAPAAAPRTRQVISRPGPGFVPFPGPQPRGRLSPAPRDLSSCLGPGDRPPPWRGSAGLHCTPRARWAGRKPAGCSVLAACPSEGQRASQVRQQTWEGWPGTAGLGRGVSPRPPWAVPGRYAG